MRNLIEKLSHRSHESVVVVPDVNFHFKNLDQFTVRTFAAPYTKEYIESMIKDYTNEVFEEKRALQKATDTYDRMMNMTRYFVEACKNLLYNETFLNDLETHKFDAMLTDPVFPCGEIIAQHLSIPTVFFMRGALFGVEQEATKSPNPLSYVPRFFTVYTDHMTFNERVKNFLLRYVEMILCRIFYAPFAQLASDFLHREVSGVDLFSRASIWLLRHDNVFEFPRPYMPNMVLIGGINCATKKPLNQYVICFLPMLEGRRLAGGGAQRLTSISPTLLVLAEEERSPLLTQTGREAVIEVNTDHYNRHSAERRTGEQS
ncbi:PREDICTED: UDP-glucuronosyltransferase 1-3-like [Nanorana parkeri]|uniref:UDP-glucuronosyltransferase 1-3-like n=1 Tax=Nanorana parkeri TaxID=125878 RepID=UPI000854ECEE|nr:PREDICTED: UDP-glucuronosyltransferase 1-3-like [Nanorana parkeri]